MRSRYQRDYLLNIGSISQLTRNDILDLSSPLLEHLDRQAMLPVKRRSPQSPYATLHQALISSQLVSLDSDQELLYRCQ
jgi:hypothetical protein